MATNLRLNERTAKALREAAARSGKSQQNLIREALDRYLGIEDDVTDLERLVGSGRVKAPTPFIGGKATIVLPEGMTSLDLLDRDDR